MNKLGYALEAGIVVGALAAVLVMGCSEADGSTSSAANESAATEPGSRSDDKTKGDGNASVVDDLAGFESFHPQGEGKVYYTGYDGVSSYVAPIAFFADAAPKVTIEDPSVAELKGQIKITKAIVKDLPDALDGKVQLLLLRSTGAGETKVTAKAGDITQTATLRVTKYTPEDVAVGERRYEKGAPACMSCHASKSVHNPSVLVDLSDETILGIAVNGKSIKKISTETGLVETLQPNGGRHTWNVTDEERVGLMAYLRSRSLTFQRP